MLGVIITLLGKLIMEGGLFKMTLGEKLYELRKQKGYSLRGVQEATDRKISYSYLSQLENDDKENPSREKLEILADLYGVNLSYLFASEKSREALKPDEKEYFEEVLRDKTRRDLFRISRGMSEDDLVKVIRIMKAFKDGELD